jgi:hypothetical protein
MCRYAWITRRRSGRFGRVPRLLRLAVCRNVLPYEMCLSRRVEGDSREGVDDAKRNGDARVDCLWGDWSAAASGG